MEEKRALLGKKARLERKIIAAKHFFYRERSSEKPFHNIKSGFRKKFNVEFIKELYILEVNWKRKKKMEVKMTYPLKPLFQSAFCGMWNFYESLAHESVSRWNLVRFLDYTVSNVFKSQQNRL